MYNSYVECRAERLTPVGLAFIGDAVYTLHVREHIVKTSDGVVGTLHTAATRIVNAKAQAAVYDVLAANDFTEEEADVARRAKNAHLHSRSKNASVDDYHKATALEAVIGHLYLSGDTQRLDTILNRCMEISDRQA